MNVRRAYLDADGRELIGAAGAARALGVTPSAVSMWTARGTGPLPAPAMWLAGGRRGRVPLWTADEVAGAVARERARLAGELDGLAARIARLESRERATRARLARMSDTAGTSGADSVVSAHGHTATVYRGRDTAGGSRQNRR